MGNEMGNPDNPDGLLQAQGLYYPSAGARKVVTSGRLDALNFNFDEDEREWNRGDAQQRTKELKEAYVDLELLDSRLWLRLGLQNIVWGKTELFRTTDQFNPQDVALSTLPSLEESRIALWADANALQASTMMAPGGLELEQLWPNAPSCSGGAEQQRRRRRRRLRALESRNGKLTMCDTRATTGV